MTKTSAPETFKFELHCGQKAPGENTDLARLFDYAEEHEGELVHVELEFYSGDCSCDHPEKASAPDRLQLLCNVNPEWWLAKRIEQYHCVEALGLAGYSAGVGSICFPTYSNLPLKVGYIRELTATHEKIVGNFLLDWEWSLGAPHVVLVTPE